MLRSFLIVALLCTPFVVSSWAFAYDRNVRKYCKDDYVAHCSQHEVGSAALRACMRKVGPNLKPACVNALVQSGEVAGKDRARRRAERH